MEGKESLSGGHLCHVCGYQYPNANPRAKLRRSHRKSCGKTPAAAAGADERKDDAAEAEPRNAVGEGLVPPGRGGGGGGGEPEENGSPGEANAGSASLGSAKGDADLVEVKESSEHTSLNVAGVQDMTDSCSETGLMNRTNDFDEIRKEVGRPAEREDSLDEYQDASPFLHQSDSEVGETVAEKSEFSIEEIKNLDSFSSGVSVAANEISVEIDGAWKEKSSGQPDMTDSGESEVGKDVGCHSDSRAELAEPTVKLESSDELSLNIYSDNTDMVDSNPNKTSDSSEFIDDMNGSTLLISDLESQSTCPRKVESLMEDSLDVLHIISEVSSSSEKQAGPANGESETENNSGNDFVQTEDELKLTNAVNTLTECPSQCKHVKDTLDVQLPVENSCLGDSVCSLDGHQSDHAVTNMDSMWGSDDEDICSEGIKAKGSELGFSCEERPQHVEQSDYIAAGNPFVVKPNGFSEEQVCSKEIGPEVPAIDQVCASQEHAALQMDQMSSTKNPFILDDTRSDDLFELATESYHSPNVAQSKQEVDFTPLPLDQLPFSDQTSIAKGQHSVISDNHILAISSASGNEPAVGTVDVSVSSTYPTKKISLHDAPVNHNKQEDGECVSGINFVPSQVSPPEFSTKSTSQDMNAVKTDENVNAPLEDISTKGMTASLSVDDVEEKKETEGTSVKEMDSIPKADNVEEEKLTDGTSAEMNAVHHTDDAEKKQSGDSVSRETSTLQNLQERQQQAEDTGAKGVPAVGSMGDTDVENQTENTDAKEMKAGCETYSADGKKQTNDTSTEETNENSPAQDACSKDTDTMQTRANAEEKNHTEDPALANQEGNKQNEDISLTAAKQNSERVHVPLKVLLAEASVETKEKKTTAKERVLSFRRRASKDDPSSAKSGSTPKAGADDNKYWSSPARLPENNAEKKSKPRRQPWMPFICCHSVH
uniref:Uncharacterized protein n=2 Tax=Oryza brachyantha TaxID=4533 RepID=J3MYX0_ORYBR